MRRIISAMTLTVALLTLTAGVALAALTFHSGPDFDFSAPPNGATVTFNVSGLGNDPATAELQITGTAQTFCHNGGKKANTAPGQNPAIVTGGSGPVDLSESDKHGRDDVVISSVLPTPAVPTAQAAGCPNGKWTVSLGPLTVTSATLVITYNGQIIFTDTQTP